VSSPGKVGRDQCRRCGQTDHWTRECPQKPKKEVAHFVQDEEEVSLLLVRSTPLAPLPAPIQISSSPAAHVAAVDTTVVPLGGRSMADSQAAAVETLLVATSTTPGGGALGFAQGSSTVVLCAGSAGGLRLSSSAASAV
jgi:hypothetical protein